MLIKKSVLLLLLLLLSLGLFACQDVQTAAPPELPERLPVVEEVEATTVRVYYATTDHRYLVPLNLSINATRDAASVALELLLAGPPNSFVGAVVPADTKLLDLYSIDNIVYVNLTYEFAEVAYENARLAVESILCTILPLAEGRTLQILIEGRVIDSLGPVDISMPLALPFVNLHAADRALLSAGYSGLILTYYLSDNMSMYLVPQTMLYLTAPGIIPTPEAQARVVVERLLQNTGPDSSLFSPFWAGTELLGTSVYNGVAYIDFSASLLAYDGGTSFEMLMLEALLFTLCGLPDIEAVQILIEGQKITNLPEGADISRPLAPIIPLNNI